MKRNTPALRAECARRYVEGESVTVLCQFYGVSRPAVYQWIAAATGKSPPSLAKRLAELEARVAAMELKQ